MILILIWLKIILENKSTEEMKEYIKNNAYGSIDNPELCFGIIFPKTIKETHEYEYLLHYFADYTEESIQDLLIKIYMMNLEMDQI